ncbi:hypothetical protein GCM10023334_067360 [Nonomuraea thailandensis]
MATHYDKRAYIFVGPVTLAALIIWLRTQSKKQPLAASAGPYLSGPGTRHRGMDRPRRLRRLCGARNTSGCGLGGAHSSAPA